MGSDYAQAIGAALAGALAMLALVGVVVLFRRSRDREDLAQQLQAAQHEVDDLRVRLEEANARLEAPKPVAAPTRRARRESPEYLITDAGLAPALLEDGTAAAEPVAVPDRLVLSATVGVPLVRAAAFSHGLRRALSAESRNRIWFEMRREVRASRKRRRRLLKDYERTVRAQERAGEVL